MNAPMEATRFGSGQKVRRIEDPALVTGTGHYTDDETLPGQTHLVFLRSPYAHADITGIDTSAALAMPGVVAIYTGADLVAAGVKPMAGVPFPRPDGKPGATAPRRALAHERVRFVGEAVAVVVADSVDQARAAADAIQVDYNELPSVVNAFDAMAPGAPALCEAAPDNIAAGMAHGDVAATAAAFAAAAHTVRVDVDNQRLAPSPIEPRAVSARVPADGADAGRLVVRISSQMPTAVRGGLADAIPGLTPEGVRVLVGDVGGGFGMKTGIYPEDIAIGYAAWTLKRPVKWRADRIDEFLGAVHGRDVVSRAELALDNNGKVLALRVKGYANVGGYGTATGIAIQVLIGPWVSTSIYDIPVIDEQFVAVLTNTTPTGAYRGAGRPEAIYLIERLMDAAARKLKIDPAELRRRNMIRPEQMPYKNAMGQLYDSGAFEQILDQGLALADWNGFAARRAQQRGQGQEARSRHRHLPGMDRRQCAAGNRDGQRHRRRLHRTGLGHPGHGPGHRHQLCPAGGRRVRRAHRPHPRAAGRHRPRQRLRQRRLALAVHRRLGGQRRVEEDGGRRQEPGGRGAGSPRSRHRVQGRPLQRGRHRPGHRPVRTGRQAGGRAHHRHRRRHRRPAPPGPTAAMCARSSSTLPPATCRWWPMPRSTTSAGW